MHVNKKEFIVIWLFLLMVLPGCATYKLHYGVKPYDKGYVASRDDYTILEYTVGTDNSVPDFKLAQERFNRRRKKVEDYYKKMGYIENNFKTAFWDHCVMFLNMIGGVFILPSLWVAEYRNAHNPQYRERMQKIEQDRQAREEARIKKLRDELNVYIQEDLAKEGS